MAQEGLTVPSQMRFADIDLTIEPRTRERIQQRVNQIAGNWTLYSDLSERSQIYSPLITQTLREEGCPDDLQYIAFLLSGLSADASSPRQPGATGFWLMSADIAKENGLQVDNAIDERKSIISATRAFARAMHKNNYSMRNWIYAFTAYNVGLSNAFNESNGVERARIGTTQLPVNAKTPDHIIDLLAYTSVFRNQQNVVNSPIKLLVYNQTAGKTLDAIARAANLPVEQVRYYNSWLISGNIPRNLPVYLPVPAERVAAVSKALQISNPNQGFAATATQFSDAEATANGSPYPIITNRIDRRIGNKDFTFATINGISGMIAADGQSIDELAAAAGISKSKLIQLNDFNDKAAVLGAGQVLYLKAKTNKGPVKDHVALPNESFWSIAQNYGMTLSSLLKLNRIEKNEALQPGRVLVLQQRRPKNTAPEYRELPAINPTSIQDAPELQVDNTITDPNAGARNTGIHIVQTGESIYEIASKYGVTITDLRRWNGITGFTLTPGMELKIRGESLPAIAADTTSATIAGDNTSIDSTLLAPPTNDIDVLTATGTATQAQPTHKVQPGDNLYSIAQKYNITTSNLRAWNNLSSTAIIKPGDVLKLYDPTAIVVGSAQQLGVVSAETQTVKHRVQRGENLTKIASKYNTTVANLRAWNNLQTDAIAINQELIVSGVPIAANAATPNTGTSIVNVMPQGSTSTATVGTNNKGIHELTFGQSVEDIVRMYNLNIDDFYRWNNLPQGSTTFPTGVTRVYVADPATANNTFNVTPQPYTNPSANVGNAMTQPALTGTAVTATGNITVQNTTATAAATYKVGAGETLFSIADKFKIPVKDLMQWNNMDMSTKLQFGQMIFVQAPESSVAVGTEGGIMLSNLSEPTTSMVMRGGNANMPASSANPAVRMEEARIYTSIPGDNIYDLANRFGVRLSEFKKWNNIPAGVFTLPVGTPIAINEAAAAQVAAMKAQAAQSKTAAKGVIAETARPSTNQQATTQATGKGSVIYHVVNKGETLFSIAQKYKVKVEQIKKWNNLPSDRVNAGARIIVSQ